MLERKNKKSELCSEFTLEEDVIENRLLLNDKSYKYHTPSRLLNKILTVKNLLKK